MAKPPVKAHQLAAQLAEQISAGELPTGSWLPSERQLAETYEAGRSTVRQAIQVLINQGLVEEVAGSGRRIMGGPRGQRDDDGPEISRQLAAIHDELRQIGTRLATIEEQTRTRDDAH